MGRRSISSTKAGKFMNPTDQASEPQIFKYFLSKCKFFIFNLTGKEARRKELKKNKKQRLQVRQAVIKQKDPKLIFSEMEAIDKMGKLFKFLTRICFNLNFIFFIKNMIPIIRLLIMLKFCRTKDENSKIPG